MATIFTGTLAARTSNATVVALAAPLNGFGLALVSDQAVSVRAQISLDAGATYVDHPGIVDLPLAGSLFRTVAYQGADHVKFMVFNNSDTLANITLEGNPATF